MDKCAECFGCYNSLWALDKEWKEAFPLPGRNPEDYVTSQLLTAWMNAHITRTK